jgi:hypothetical protein
MGFHGITAGRWLAEKLYTEFGMKTDCFDFGCDLSSYQRLRSGPRSGVAFYAQPWKARRGFELGLMAIELLASRHPSIEIHVFGESIGKLRTLSKTVFDHGRVKPAELNEIYNQCYAGLCLSLTNVSLVPHEMLACGCIPVVNDAYHNRLVLNNEYVRYAPLNPHALAAELEAVVAMRDFELVSLSAAMSVRSASWDDAGAKIDSVFRRVLEE